MIASEVTASCNAVVSVGTAASAPVATKAPAASVAAVAAASDLVLDLVTMRSRLLLSW